MRVKTKWKAVLLPVAVAAILYCFFVGLSNLESGQRAEGKEQLESVIRRTAVSCYAAEGVYPPNLEYMKEHYGIRFDEEKYMVDYQVIASNLMPDITVLELDDEE